MCGFAGFFSKQIASDDYSHVAERMAATLEHRGPDESGSWSDASAGFAVAHQRLAILDLSRHGHQPMLSASGRWVLAYNGEIYNHLDLRKQLKSSCNTSSWRGHSDTETLLACIDAWGIEETLSRVAGMFAFALWDRQERALTLARDRMGEKPLYYGWQNKTFLFGSELKALRTHPSFKSEVNRNALTLLLRHNCIPAPYSIYAGINKIRPGHTISFDFASNAENQDGREVAYWRLNDVVEQGIRHPFPGTESEAVEAMESQLSESIGAQMLSDVPLGAFLSGGIDSSTIAALMQSQSSRPIKTFTVGFADEGYNEASEARAVASHLGTDHTELTVTPEDALSVIPQLPSIYCEPFSDSSQIPTVLISKLVRQNVTVALSGDAGDELFGGYNRYLMANQVWRKIQRLPKIGRSSIAAILRGVPPSGWDRAYSVLEPLVPAGRRVSTPGDKIHKLADVIGVDDQYGYYRRLTSHFPRPTDIVPGSNEPLSLVTDSSTAPEVDCFEHWMMAMDAKTYLPDDILVKVDRAAMASSLETRAPFLDHRVAELAWKLPIRFKVGGGITKGILRNILHQYVPKELVERPKMGFSVPLDRWLRGPLRDWAEDLLSQHRFESGGFFRPEPITKMWSEHLSGKRSWQYHLWTVLMFQAWLEEP